MGVLLVSTLKAGLDCGACVWRHFDVGLEVGEVKRFCVQGCDVDIPGLQDSCMGGFGGLKQSRPACGASICQTCVWCVGRCINWRNFLDVCACRVLAQ